MLIKTRCFIMHTTKKASSLKPPCNSWGILCLHSEDLHSQVTSTLSGPSLQQTYQTPAFSSARFNTDLWIDLSKGAGRGTRQPNPLKSPVLSNMAPPPMAVLQRPWLTVRTHLYSQQGKQGHRSPALLYRYTQYFPSADASHFYVRPYSIQIDIQ